MKVAAVFVGMCIVAADAQAQTADPRLRELLYDSRAVVTVPVKRGVVTHVMLDADEAITEVGAGLGGDCSKADAAWCVATQAGGRHIFVKPKSGAGAPNNLAVVTDRRTHAFRFVLLPDDDARLPVYRLVVKAAPPRPASTPPPAIAALPVMPLPPIDPQPSPEELIAERLQTPAQLQNSNYSIAEGAGSQDIVPALIFDDGRFTYIRFPGNREVPAVFHVQPDGSETLVNARMEDDLLVVDRVSRRLMLRAGQAVVGVWNESFDLDGLPPAGGTTVPGVQRLVRAEAIGAVAPARTGAAR